MIQTGTYLKVIDNSGAKLAFCIKILNAGYQQRYATVGSTVLVSIKSIRSVKNIKAKKGEMHRAVIIKVKTPAYSFSTNYKHYFENAVVLLNKQNKPLGTRIFSRIPKALKYTRFLKLATISLGLSF